MSGFHITPHMLEAAYDFLRTTPPFNRWKLPEADDVEFRVTRDSATAGWCNIIDDVPTIAISDKLHGHSGPLLITLAHEIIHLREFERCGQATHGKRFRDMARTVCRTHGFDPKGF